MLPRTWPLSSYLELGALPSAVPCARLHAKHVAWEWKLDGLADTIELLVSELSTNALQAVSGREQPTYIWLRLSSDRERVLIEVWDADPRPPVTKSFGDDDVPAVDQESGRGLFLIAALSQSWSWYPVPQEGGKVVWCELVAQPSGEEECPSLPRPDTPDRAIFSRLFDKEEMIMIDVPPVRRLLLGGALRRYRENLGFVLEDAARVLECDRSKISRIETGQRGIRSKELRELLTEYGVSEPEQDALAAIAYAGRRGTWHQDSGDEVPGPYREYVALEQAASDIFAYDPLRIPELLQTPQYAQAVTAGAMQSTSAKLRLSRQQALDERQPRLTALIGEAALRQVTGHPDVMRDQLRVLAAYSERVVVQVLPSDCGAPSSGPVTILRFAEVPSLGAVYLPGLSGGICLADQQDVASYTLAFERLRACALTPATSACRIREIAGE